MRKGTLYLIPTTLGGSPHLSIPPGVQELSCSLRHFVAESARTTRRYLKELNAALDLSQVHIAELNKHTSPSELDALLAPLHSGYDVGLTSEAGLPAIADPGAAVVARCHAANIAVVPLSGPSSVVLALIASGFNGQQFTFHGYLPIDRSALVRSLREMEKAVQTTGYTQVFIETPFRNQKLFEAMVQTCAPDTWLTISANLTLPDGMCRTQTVRQWKLSPPSLHKLPAVFALGKPAV